MYSTWPLTWIFWLTNNSSAIFLSLSCRPAWWSAIPKDRVSFRLLSFTVWINDSIYDGNLEEKQRKRWLVTRIIPNCSIFGPGVHPNNFFQEHTFLPTPPSLITTLTCFRSSFLLRNQKPLHLSKAKRNIWTPPSENWPIHPFYWDSLTVRWYQFTAVSCPRRHYDDYRVWMHHFPAFRLLFLRTKVTQVSLLKTLTSVSGMWSHCLGLSSAAKKEINSSAVRRVCRLDDTNTSTGLVGEWVRIAAKVGLFIVAMRGQ